MQKKYNNNIPTVKTRKTEKIIAIIPTTCTMSYKRGQEVLANYMLKFEFYCFFVYI